MICEKCGLEIEDEQVSMGGNLGFGPFYVCLTCLPPGTLEEVVESIDLAINPIKE